MTPPSSSRRWASIEDRIPRTQLLWVLTIGIGLATMGVGMVGIHTPWREKLSDLEQKYQEELKRQELLSTLRFQITQLKKQEEKIAFQGGTPALTSEVSRLGTQASLQIESVVPQPEVSFGPYTQYQIRVIATSTFSDLLHFLRLLDQQKSLLKVDTIEVGEPSWAEASYGYEPAGRFEQRPKALEDLETDQHRTIFLISAFSHRGAAP